MNRLIENIKEGYRINKKEAMDLIDIPLEQLKLMSQDLKKFYNKDQFNICGIINGKNGGCTEDCKFCAQSINSKNRELEVYSLRDKVSLFKEVEENKIDGIGRMAIVTSGRKLYDKELISIGETYKYILNNIDVFLCASHGLLSYEELKYLKECGISRYHCNLETSKKHFSNICTSHTYEERLRTIQDAQKAGLQVCSGGILGVGESMEDRIDLALSLQKLSIKSIPINILLPIPGTPFQDNNQLSYEEIFKTFCIFKIINPEAYIRFAAGRRYTEDRGKEIFESSSNAMISGKLLNTLGQDTKSDIKFINKLGFKVVS